MLHPHLCSRPILAVWLDRPHASPLRLLGPLITVKHALLHGIFLLLRLDLALHLLYAFNDLGAGIARPEAVIRIDFLDWTCVALWSARSNLRQVAW